MSIPLFLILTSVAVLALYFIVYKKSTAGLSEVVEDKVDLVEPEVVVEEVEEAAPVEAPAPAAKKPRAKSTKKKPDLKVAK